MKRVNISNLVPGMITAEDVYTYGNQLIIPKHTILNDKAITRLEFYSIVSIRVEDAPADLPTPAVSASSSPSDIPYSQWVQSTPEFKKFKQDYDESVDDFKNSINDIVEKGSEIKVDEVLQADPYGSLREEIAAGEVILERDDNTIHRSIVEQDDQRCCRDDEGPQFEVFTNDSGSSAVDLYLFRSTCYRPRSRYRLFFHAIASLKSNLRDTPCAWTNVPWFLCKNHKRSPPSALYVK